MSDLSPTAIKRTPSSSSDRPFLTLHDYSSGMRITDIGVFATGFWKSIHASLKLLAPMPRFFVGIG